MNLKGELGYKGERGYSAYEIAVKNGFKGTERDWLAQLGTSIGIHQYYELYTTSTTGEDTFNLPEEYIANCFVEVFKNGLRLSPDEYSVDSANKTVTLSNSIAEIGTKVQLIATLVTTNSLPIVDTIDVNSSNETVPGTKSIYDFVIEKTINKYSKTEVNELLGFKANADDVYSKTEVDTRLNGKSNTTHNHNGSYYTKTDSDNRYQRKILSGTSEPSSSLGSDGDIYIKY